MSILLPIVSGILIGTSYIPFPPWASLFAFVPLWIFYRQAKTWKEIFVGGWITQFVLTLIGFNWVTFTVHEFGHLPWALSFVVLLFFCAVANLDIPLAGVAWFLVKRRWLPQTGVSLAFLAIITALFESWVPTLFPWNYGYTLFWSHIPAMHVAELIGFQGISALVILTNLLSLKIWHEKKTAGGKWSLAALVLWLIFLNFAGQLLKKNIAAPDAEARVMITQANIGNLEKQYAQHGAGFREPIMSRYQALTEQALAKTQEKLDFIVWPETAVPYEVDLRGRTYGEELLVGLVQKWGVNLVTGGYGYGINEREMEKVSNSFFIFETGSTSVQPKPYIKTHLLAFGEYIPGAEIFPQIKKWIPAGDFARGSGPSVKSVNAIQIGPQICYESLFPSLSAELARADAQMFVNLTNDSWYGTWQEPYQHLYMTLARAIEFRRPVVRSTNTGISTVALADGTVLAPSSMNSEWAGIYVVPYLKKPVATFYQNYPWLIEGLLIILALVVFGIGATLGRTAKSGLV